MRLHRKGAARLGVAPFDYLHLPPYLLAQLLHQLPRVARIGPDQGQMQELWPIELQRLGKEARPITVLDISGGDDHFEDESLRIDQQVPLAPLYLFVRVVAARPPF